MTIAVVPLWRIQGRFEEAAQRVEAALAVNADGDPYSQARLEGLAGSIALEQGDLEQSRHHALASLELAREIGDALDVGRALVDLGRIAAADGCIDDAYARLTEASEVLTLVEGAGPVQASVELNLGDVALISGDAAAAERHSAAAVELAQANDREEMAAVAQANRAHAAVLAGSLALVEEHAHDALRRSAAIGFMEGETLAALLLAVALRPREPRHATFLIGAVSDSLGETGLALRGAERLLYHDAVTSCRADLSREEYEAELEAGRRTGLEVAVEQLLARQSRDMPAAGIEPAHAV